MRDRKGRFKKLDDDEITFKITLPSLKRLLYFVLLIAILFPWIIIGNKFNIPYSSRSCPPQFMSG